jgi:hypothetical protein
MSIALNIILMAIVFCTVVGLLAVSILRARPERPARSANHLRRPAPRPAGAPSKGRQHGSAQGLQA